MHMQKRQRARAYPKAARESFLPLLQKFKILLFDRNLRYLNILRFYGQKNCATLNSWEESDQLVATLISLKMAERSEAKSAKRSFASKLKNWKILTRS